MQRASRRYILPEDAVFMRQATQKACARAKSLTDGERDGIANAVLWIARSGYARLSDGTIDPDALAEAALLQFWRVSDRASTMNVAATRSAPTASVPL